MCSGSLFHQPVGNTHGHDPDPGVGVGQFATEIRPEPIDHGTLFHGDQQFGVLRQLVEQGPIIGLEEPAIDHSRLDPVLVKPVGRRERWADHGTHRKDRSVLPGPEEFPRPERHGGRFRYRAGRGRHFVARIASAERAAVMGEAGFQEPDQFIGIFGRGYHHAGHRQHVGNVVETHVGLAVLAHQARPVHAEHHGQVLDRDVVDDVVVGPLQEGGIDGAHRPDP